MFICKDDSIYAMGRELACTDPRGWLKKVPKPEDCKSYKRIHYNSKFTVILTEESRMFICGKDFDDVIPLKDCDDAEEALKEFKEIDVDELFPEILNSEKITDLAIGGNWP